MSLKTTIQAAATSALKQAQSLAVAATYTSKGVEAYDADTGVPTSSDSTTAIQVFLVAVKEVERDGKTTPNTKKAIFDRDGFVFEAKAEDTITLGAGSDDEGVWEVVSVLSEPSASIYVLEVRRP